MSQGGGALGARNDFLGAGRQARRTSAAVLRRSQLRLWRDASAAPPRAPGQPSRPACGCRRLLARLTSCVPWHGRQSRLAHARLTPCGWRGRAGRRWQVLEQMEKTFATQRGMGLQQDGESDELKRIFLEGNPLLLVRAGCAGSARGGAAALALQGAGSSGRRAA